MDKGHDHLLIWCWDIDTIANCLESGQDIHALHRPYVLWTVEELKEEMRSRKLMAGGNKDTLIKRLEENDNEKEKL